MEMHVYTWPAARHCRYFGFQMEEGVWARLSVVRVESGCEDAAQSKHALNVASAGASSQELVANSREAGGLFCFWPGSADATPQWQWKLETNICAGRGRRPKGKARSGPCLSCL